MNYKHLALSTLLFTGLATAHDIDSTKITKDALNQCIEARVQNGEEKGAVIASLITKVKELEKDGQLSSEESEALCAELSDKAEEKAA